jgi:hypothetical protein
LLVSRRSRYYLATGPILHNISLLDNWVHDVGFTNEKLHAGIIQRLLLRAAPAAQRAILDALWLDATGSPLAIGAPTSLKIQREAPLDGRKLRLDLLVSFAIGQRHHRLGIELKVDSRPDHAQLSSEWVKLKQSYPNDHCALVLFCLGTAQVCGCKLPDGVHRWSVLTLLARRELLASTLPGDPIVAGWLASLSIENQRRMLVLSPPPDLAETYRNWSYSAYWLGRPQADLAALDIPALAPWQTKIHANGPVITAEGSWRNRQDEGTRIWVFVEINWGGLYVKAGAEQETKQLDPRSLTQMFFDALHVALRNGATAVRSETARFRPGEFSSLLKIPLGLPCDLQRICDIATQVGRVWAELPALFGLLPE